MWPTEEVEFETPALHSVKNSFDLLLLDHSLEYCTHSAIDSQS